MRITLYMRLERCQQERAVGPSLRASPQGDALEGANLCVASDTETVIDTSGMPAYGYHYVLLTLFVVYVSKHWPLGYYVSHWTSLMRAL